MKRTRYCVALCFYLGLVLLVFQSAMPVGPTANAQQAKNDPDKKEWIQLFNGKDLKNWDIKIKGYDLNDNFGNTFRVENGLLKVGYEKYDKFNDRYDRWKERCEASFGMADVIIAKQRHGPIGTVKLHFEAETTKFDNVIGPERLPSGDC